MADNVDALLEQRGNQWGDAIGTHVRIAQVWSGILGHEVQAVEVALMMEGLKLVRASINPSDPDSFHDAQGYSRIAELIAGHRKSLDDKDHSMVDVPACHGCGNPNTKGGAYCGNCDPDPTCTCQHPKSAHYSNNGSLATCMARREPTSASSLLCSCLVFRRQQ